MILLKSQKMQRMGLSPVPWTKKFRLLLRKLLAGQKMGGLKSQEP